MSSTGTTPSAAAVSPSTFILGLPKAELHLHLEGSIEPATLAEISQRYQDKLTLPEAEALYSYPDFTGFMLAFKATVQRLRSAEDYEAITYSLMKLSLIHI